MEKLYIKGGSPLEGELAIKGAKNSILPLLSACIMCEGNSCFQNVPDILDVRSMLKILEQLGCSTTFENGTVCVDSTNMKNHEIPDSLASTLRSSIFIMGSVLAKFKKATVAYPGGCDIGLRPINLHLEGLKSIGVKIVEESGYILCDGQNITGGTVILDFPSVGATENIMMASVLSNSTTIIKNSAREPEIVDLANYINQMGGNIKGAGKSTIVITGVKKLNAICYKPIPDRIVAGTYLIACAMTGGEIVLNDVCPEHISSLINKLRESTCNIVCKSGKIILRSGKPLKSIKKIVTSPYPAFPTDLQAQAMALMTVASGVSVFVENIFETRYRHVGEFIKMGADITISDRTAIVVGVPKLYGANVTAYDLRGGAGLVLTGLVAEGTSCVSDIYHIDRGYDHIENDLKSLGASVYREG